jgi:predicted DNA-binding transcriptional regulator AlpA
MSVMSTGLGDDERRVAAPKPITITIPTACAMSGVGPTKIWQLIKSGKLPVTRALGRVLIHYAPFEALLLSPDETPRKKMPVPAQVRAARKNACR